MSTAELYEAYKTKMQKIADLRYTAAVLQWDQETYLPPKGNDGRGRQLATLSELAHEQFIDESIGNLLMELNGKHDLDAEQKRNVELSLEDHTKSKKLPSAFVRQMSEAINKSFHAWISARKENSFAVFCDPLDELIQLKKQEAEYMGYEHHPYNALLNEYDKGLTVIIADKLFAELKPELLAILETIKKKPVTDDSFLRQHFDKDSQWKFGIKIL